jgi:general secretion pathway protein A
MYLSHYNLKIKPFQISTDPKFLWLGEKHKEALATLKYGTLDNKGFLLLTGDIGTGKTTLINALIESVGDGTVIATVPDPGLEKLDFFNYIAYAFKLKKRFDNKGAFLVHFSHFLHDVYKKNKNALLIIDEAQRLNQELLEEIRLLSNIEKQDTKLINIFFVGQKEFNDILLANRNRALRQRITLNYNLDPLTERETGKYIQHRLKVAGLEENIFSSGAIREIVSFASGNPRLINICCDHALLTGYVKGLKKIDAKIIRECAEELKIPGKVADEKVSGSAPFKRRLMRKILV